MGAMVVVGGHSDGGSGGAARSINESASSMAGLCSGPWQDFSRAEDLGLHAEQSRQKPLSAGLRENSSVLEQSSGSSKEITQKRSVGGACGETTGGPAALDGSSGRHLLKSNKTQRGATQSTRWGRVGVLG